MIEVSEAFQKAYLNGRQKHILLEFSDGSTLDNSGVVAESLTIEQVLCDEEQIIFGLVSSSSFKIQIYNTGKKYNGLSVTVILGAVDEDEQYHIMNLGTYKITDDVRTDDRMYRNITAYDSLYDVLGTNYAAFYNNYFSAHPDGVSLKTFRDAFFAHIGITQENATLPHDGITIHGKEGIETISGTEMIRNICEPNAVFGFVNYDGKFQYIFPMTRYGRYPAEDLYPRNDIYPGEGVDFIVDTSDSEAAPVQGSFIYSDYYTHKITQVCIPENETTAEALVGKPGNCYRFQQNVLLYNQRDSVFTQIATRFYELTRMFFYTPTSVSMRCRPWVQVGDVIAVITNGESTRFPIMHRIITGVSALYDKYSAKGTEYYRYSANLTKNTIADYNVFKEKTKVRLNKNEESITAEVTRATAAEGTLSSQIEVAAGNINLKVSKNEVISAINLSPEQISINAGKINLNGAVTANNNVMIGVDGKITINGGAITITDGSTKTFHVGSDGSMSANAVSITGGSLSISNSSTQTFSVTNDGKLTATGVDITGEINATGGTFSGNIKASGTITGGTINGASISTYAYDPSSGSRIDISSGAIVGYFDGGYCGGIDTNASWYGSVSDRGIDISANVLGLSGKVLTRTDSDTYWVTYNGELKLPIDFDDRGRATEWLNAKIVNGMIIS